MFLFRLSIIVITISLTNTARADVVDGKLCFTPQFVAVDTFDTQEFRQLIKVGIVFWNNYAGKKLLSYEPMLSSVGDMPWVIASVASVGDLKGNEGGIARIRWNKMGQEKCISGSTIKVEGNAEFKNQVLLSIIHELGHAIGIDHSNWYGTIMFPSLNNNTQFKLGKDTKEELKKLYGDEK